MATFRLKIIGFLALFCFTIFIYIRWTLTPKENVVVGSKAQSIPVKSTRTKTTLPDNIQGNIISVLNLLEKVRNGSSDKVNRTDLDSGIKFLTKMLDNIEYFKNPHDTVNVEVKDEYVQPIGEWNTDRGDWQETFYPGAEYTGEVCGERLVRKHHFYPGWPYFSFKESCINESAKMTSKVVTILLNVVSYSEHHLKELSSLLDGIYAIYPQIDIIMAVPSGLSFTTKHKVRIIETSTKEASGKTWNNLVKEVKTPYTFIGRDLIHFDDDCRLERLIREIPSLKIPIIGGSVKTPSDGHWLNGCHQVAYRNYTLVYKSGYKHSAHDCLYCNFILGPFVAKTSALKDTKFHETMAESTLFHDLFFRIYKKNLKVGVCPDIMFLVRDEVMVSLNRTQWLPMAATNELNKVVTPEGKTFTFTCEESHVDGKLRKGFGTAPSKLQKLADHIKFVMKMCRENNILCVTNAGTSVGALKLNSVLPWEKDADILYYNKNLTAMKTLIPLYPKNGPYTLRKENEKHFEANVFHTPGSGWKIDLYPFPELFTEKLKYKGEKMTKILFDGDWIETPRNIARQIRDRYGPEIYKHVQHSSELNKKQFTVRTGYKWTGHFTKCPKPGAHDCLDLVQADGNLQFGDPTP